MENVIMKKRSFIGIISLLLMFTGCGGDSSSVDPIAGFRTFATDLKQLAHDESMEAGKGSTASYLIASEDLLLQELYCVAIFNKVIDFKPWNTVNNIYTNTDRDSTITVSGGNYLFKSDYYLFIGASPTVEKIHVEFSYDSRQSRWLITGLRGGDANTDPTAPWIRQEGEKVSNTLYYLATTFYFHEEGVRHINNAIFTYGTTSNTIRMACERETCTTGCLDITTTPLYDQGIQALGRQPWDSFKTYGINDGNPDYNIP